MTKKGTYQLKEAMVTEYEWDKGPRPSGYAQLKLQLKPTPDDEENLQIGTSPNVVWSVRPTKYAKKNPLAASTKAAFMEMIFEGVRDGAEQALLQSLNLPVTNAMVVLEHASFDLEYSTKMAFRIAARSAIDEILKEARDRELLRLVE